MIKCILYKFKKQNLNAIKMFWMQAATQIYIEKKLISKFLKNICPALNKSIIKIIMEFLCKSLWVFYFRSFVMAVNKTLFSIPLALPNCLQSTYSVMSPSNTWWLQNYSNKIHLLWSKILMNSHCIQQRVSVEFSLTGVKKMKKKF